MKIKTIEASVSIESRYGMGLSRWDGRKMIAEIGENEDEMLASAELQQKVEVSLGITKLASFEEIPINAPLPSIDYKAKERVEILIENSANIPELATYKESAIEYGLIIQYMSKLKSLTNETRAKGERNSK